MLCCRASRGRWRPGRRYGSGWLLDLWLAIYRRQTGARACAQGWHTFQTATLWTRRFISRRPVRPGGNRPRRASPARCPWGHGCATIGGGSRCRAPRRKGRRMAS